MIRTSRLKRVILKEFRQYFRDKTMLRMSIIIPVFQTLILSYAATTDVAHVPTVVCDQDRSQQSREFVQILASLPTFDVRGYALELSGVQRELDMGRAELGVYIPPNFAKDLARSQAQIQILVNGADSVTATTAATYLLQASLAYDIKVKTSERMRQGLAGPPLASVRSETRVFYNPDLRSMWFMAPGVMVMLLFVLLQNFAALSIAKEKELGTFEQMVMTPIRPSELLLGKLVPYALIGAVDALVITLMVVFALDTPLRGSISLLVASLGVFIFATLGLGLLISAASANQQQAQIMNFFLSFPSILLSGFIFPRENLPVVLEWVSRGIPMTYLLRIVRGVFLKGSGWAELFSANLVPMMLLAVVFFAAGAARFRKKLE